MTLTPMELIKQAEQARRWAMACELAGEHDEARHWIAMATRYDILSTETREAA